MKPRRKKSNNATQTFDPPKTAWEAILQLAHEILGNRGVYALVIIVAVPGAFVAVYKALDQSLEHFSESVVAWMAENAAATSHIALNFLIHGGGQGYIEDTSSPSASNDLCIPRISQSRNIDFAFAQAYSGKPMKLDALYSVPLTPPFQIRVEPWLSTEKHRHC